MTKRLPILAFVLACATALAAQGSAPATGGYTPRTVPNVQLADANRFTSNPDGILSAGTVAEIDRMCLDLRVKQLAEVAVLVVERVDEASLDMFAHNVLNLWGVGQKGKDNGLVVSVVRGQRDIQFETGYGLEGVLPDALCKRIQTTYMIEPLRDGDFDKGVLDGVKAIYNVLTDNREELAALKAADTGNSAERVVGLGILGTSALMLVVFVALLIVLAARHNKRNGGNNRDDFGGDPGGPGAGGFGTPDAGSILGGILGGLLGGGFGGGGFGGGFGGGSFGGGFGGGRSGGGGARSGF